MVKISCFTAAIAAISIAQSAAFAPVALTQSTTELRMSNNSSNNNDFAKKIGSSLIAASFMFSTLLTPDVALASSNDIFQGSDFGPTSSLIAGRGGGRSGGRAGGRSSASTMRRAPPPSSRPTTINRTTVIQAAPSPAVIVSPGMGMGMGMGYGYNPFMPSPLGLAIGGANMVGREVREYRQEDQIREARSEAESAKQREFALEQRLAAMEQQQYAQTAANNAAGQAALNAAAAAR